MKHASICFYTLAFCGCSVSLGAAWKALSKKRTQGLGWRSKNYLAFPCHTSPQFFHCIPTKCLEETIYTAKWSEALQYCRVVTVPCNTWHTLYSLLEWYLMLWLNFPLDGIIHPQSKTFVIILDCKLINSPVKWITVLTNNTTSV